MQQLHANGLALEPLRTAHAAELFPLLADPALYEYLDYGPPPSLEHLQNVYAKLESRRSGDGTQHWLNWAVRETATHRITGFVQATVLESSVAWVAYVFGREYWGAGFARSATSAMLAHLVGDYGCASFLAMVEHDNARSIRLLQRLGFRNAAPELAAQHAASPTERLFVAQAEDVHGH